MALSAAVVVALSTPFAVAQEHIVEAIEEGPDTDEVSAEVAKLLSEKGIRVKRGATRTVCEIWLNKEWKIDGGFQSTDERLYPFTPGQEIGVLHFSRRGKAETHDYTIR